MKWIIFLVIIIAIGILIYFGQDWQVLSMIGATLAAPFKWLSGLFGGSKADEIRKEHQQVRKREQAFQEKLESGIRQKEETIQHLERQMSELDVKINELERKKTQVDAKYRSMSLDELSEVGANYFGS